MLLLLYLPLFLVKIAAKPILRRRRTTRRGRRRRICIKEMGGNEKTKKWKMGWTRNRRMKEEDGEEEKEKMERMER